MKPRLFAPTLAALALALTSAHGQITVDDTVTFTTSPNNALQRPSPYTFQVDGTFDPTLQAKTIPGALAGFDPTGSDKIIVAFASEGAGSVISITYGGEPMSEAIYTNEGGQYTGIYYLDAPTGPGDLVFTFSGSSSNGVGGSLMAVSSIQLGTAAVTAFSPGQSVDITTAEANSLIVASQANNGGGGTAQAPFTPLFDGPVGSGGGGTGYLNQPTISTVTAAIIGSTTNPVTAAAAFAPTLPRNPSPNGGIIPGGAVPLTWQNLAPATGTDVWVDVWFGSDPNNLTQVVTADPAGLNLISFTTATLLAGTYYWRVDSYLDGAPTGTPVTGTLLTFTIIDTDSDGLPDWWEELYFGDPTAANPGDDPDGDTLTNLEEFELGTDPTMADTDGDGLNDNVETNTGIWLSTADTGTDPLNPDTDGDGLPDGVETNTGTWVSSSDTGTDPLDADTDSDGLPDGVETNTGTFVSSSDTGTDPHNPNTDGDIAGDWYEVHLSFTDPTDPNDNPGIPYPLPTPDGTPGASDKPVKVYILSGQSNMVGFGQVNGDAPGTLNTITRTQNKFPNLLDAEGNFLARQDVWYRGVISALGNGPLAPGFGAGSDRIGPELGFGHVMGWYHDEPVLIIKASIGNRGLLWDLLPPGRPRVEFLDPENDNLYTYPGYGEKPRRWLSSEPKPEGGNWYAGKEFDNFFKAPGDWAPAGSVYAPGGTNVASVLDNFATEYPQWADQGFEIAGYGWFQGFDDANANPSAAVPTYQENMAQFIREIRAYYENRYPGNTIPNAPFAISTYIVGGPDRTANSTLIAQAQLAVSGEAGNYPEFVGNVKTMDTLPYWRTAEESPYGDGIHHMWNAETFMLIGDALGRAIIELDVDETPPFPNPSSFLIPPSAVESGSIGMVATTATDFSGPVEYQFENVTNSDTSGWITSPEWTNTGLTDGVSYTYRVRTRDALGNTGDWSVELGATAGTDTTAPSPDPMTFTSAPAAIGENAITMTATTAVDINGVEYFFEATDGGNNRDWLGSPEYTDTGLTPDTTYTYVVRARDSLGNTTGDSAPASATTDAPDTTPPSPDPMTFATPPTALGESSITMTAITAIDDSAVEYYFENTAGVGNDSGWLDSPEYTDTGLVASTTYTYRVRARDKSPAKNTTGWSDALSATTTAPEPQVTSLSPTNGATFVPLGSNLEIAFGENIVKGSGNITIRVLEGGGVFEMIDVTTSAVTIVGGTVTISPVAEFTPDTGYYVEIANGALKGESDNDFSGITGSSTWSFTSIIPGAATIDLDLATMNDVGFDLDIDANYNFDFVDFPLDYLIVAGGGGGGSTRNNTGRAGGGGGAGGLLEGIANISGVQSIVVGAGGAGGVGGSANGGGNGQDSVAFSLTAIGGGGGGNNVNPAGLAGGSGGGAGSPGTDGGSGTVGQGNDGAISGTTGGNHGGGGGGAGGAGVAGNDGGAGGAGLSRSITGASVTYAQGGGGGSTGARVTATPAPAPANTGNGGLGISPETSNAYNGGDGGSGIIAVSYSGTQVLDGGVVSSNEGDTVHAFLNPGASTLGLHSATINGALTGVGGFTWDAPGTLALGGNNAYTGDTFVSTGTLLVNGDQSAASGNVLVTNGATLGGTGTLGGAVTVAGDGNLAPGIGAGLLTLAADLDLSAMATGTGLLHYQLDAAASANDRIDVAGTLVIGTDLLGFSDFVFTDLGGLQPGTYSLITSGGITGTLDPADLTGDIDGQEATLEISGDNLVLVVSGVVVGSPFGDWAATFPGLTDASPTLDFDGGGLATALEWVLGGDPTNPGDDAGLMPTIDATSDPDGKLRFIFRRDAVAAADAATTIAVEYGSDLTGWTVASHQGTGPGDITISEVPDGFGAGIDQITVALPASLTATDKLFARLRVVVASP